MADAESFSAIARRLKSQSDITVRQLAEACFISESTTSRYLNGQIVPPKETADRMIQTLRAARVVDDPPDRAESGDAEHALERVEKMYLERIRDIQTTLDYERKQKRTYYIVMLAVICVFLAVTMFDVLCGDVGWFRH